jgi:alkylmercury lyase
MESVSPADRAREAQGAARADIPGRRAQLPPDLKEFHRSVLRAFLATGRPPHVSELKAAAAELGLAADEALARLAEADLVHAGADRHITVAYPFSGSDRGIHVRHKGGAGVWAMCAIDALGIPQMSGGDVVIDAVDPVSQEAVQVESCRGRLSWRPEAAVVLLADNGCGPTSAESTCPLITFHASEQTALDHLNSLPGARGQVLSQAEATELAGHLFAGLLSR